MTASTQEFNLYNASIPGFVRGLENLDRILSKGEVFAAERKIEPAVLLSSRLAPDMFPLTRQIQIATDTIKGAAARLSGTEIPSYPDTETSFAELHERIAKTVAFVKSVDADAVAASAEKDVTLKLGPIERTWKGAGYLFGFVQPQFYFHVTTAYDILRHNGVTLSKSDYLGDM